MPRSVEQVPQDGASRVSACRRIRHGLCGSPVLLAAVGLVLLAVVGIGDVAGAAPQAQGYGAQLARGTERLQAGDVEAAIARFRAALELRPGDLQAGFLLGTAYLRGERLEDATRVFEELGRSHPERAAGPFGLAQVELARGRPAAAREWLQAALERDPEHVSSWYHLARLDAGDGDPEAARHAYRRLLDVDPGARRARLELARLLLDGGEAEAAVSLLEAAPAAMAQDADALTTLGVARIRVGSSSEGREALQRAVGLDPGHAEALYNLGLLDVRERRWEAAVGSLRRAVAADPADVDARLLLAECLEETGRRDVAADVLQEGLERRPHERRLLWALGSLWANVTDRTGDAAEVFERLLESDPDDVRAMRALAEVHVANGAIAAAAELYEALYERFPGDAELAYQVGYSRRRLGDLEGARRALEAALGGRPDAAEVLYELGLLEMQAERHAAAADHLRRVVELDPHHTAAFMNLGRALRAAGRVEESRAVLERFRELERYDRELAQLRGAARRHPGDARVFLALGRHCVAGERWQEAREVLEKALRIDPGLEEARELLEGLPGEGGRESGGSR